MAKMKERDHATTLRLKGKSYSQIKEIVGVSKGTLSNWLRELPLSKERISELRDKNEVRIERYRATMQRKRNEYLASIYKQEVKFLKSITARELYIGGLFLYWGEGTKNLPYRLSLSNTDPNVIKFFIYWS